MLKYIIISIVVSFLLFGGIFVYAMAYGFPWNRFLSSWTLKSGEKIEKLSYRINSDFSEDSNVIATVGLFTNADHKKLPKGDTVTVNGQLIKPQYYNTGMASGYKYSVEIPRAEVYTLVIKRQGEKEIRKVITSRSFSVDFPKTISKSTPFFLTYKADTIPTDGKVSFVDFITLTKEKEPILMNKSNQFGASLSTKIENDKIVLDTDSALYKDNMEDWENIKTIPVIMSVGAIFDQPDGKFVRVEERQVEIVD